jgi:hypothetical protein
MNIIHLVENLIKDYLNEKDLFNKLENDILVSSNFKEFSKKGLDYSTNEIKIVEEFLTFILNPYNDHRRNGRKILFHGSPHNIEKFELTKGARSGGIFSYREVDNLGVFLTNNKKIAKFFGDNRVNHKTKSYSEIYTVFVDLGNILHFENLPPDIKKLGNYLLYKWKGKRYDISRYNFWLLLDMPDFINEVKKKYDTIIFKEGKHIFKDAGTDSGETYFIIDPNRIEIYKPLTYDELKKNIKFYIRSFIKNK